MNRHDIHLCPCPTTMHTIIGDADDALARDKFAVFALVSSLLVPNAAQLLRASLKREKDRKKRHERFVKDYYKKRRRDFKQFKEGERHLGRLLEMVEERLFFLHQPRTIHSISKRRPPFTPPHWTGDSANGLVAVPFPSSNVLTAEDAVRLVRELAYDANAAFASISRPTQTHVKSDRRRLGVWEDDDGVEHDRTNIAQPLPYVAAATRYTTQGFFSKASVLRAVAKMRTNGNMRLACIEVVYNRRSPSETASKLGLKTESLKRASTRLRNAIREGF